MSGPRLVAGCLLLLTWAVSGCTKTGPFPVLGVKPEYPVVQHVLPNGPFPIVPAVESLQPTLRWESRSIPSGEATYDLRIWQGWLGGPGELVYSRNALVDPWHTIEILLDPSTLYFWTIRERRVTNGQTRVSDWAVLKMDPSGLDDRRLARIPHPGYYRFKTPKQ